VTARIAAMVLRDGVREVLMPASWRSVRLAPQQRAASAFDDNCHGYVRSGD
jgi:hypothetical protein